MRQAQAEHDTTLYLLLDASPSMGFGSPSKFMTGRRLAASRVRHSSRGTPSVVMTTPGSTEQAYVEKGPQAPRPNPASLVQRFRGGAELGEMFRLLQGLRTRSTSGFDSYLAGWAGENPGRAQGKIAVVVSDLLLDGARWIESVGFRGLPDNGDARNQPRGDSARRDG